MIIIFCALFEGLPSECVVSLVCHRIGVTIKVCVSAYVARCTMLFQQLEVSLDALLLLHSKLEYAMGDYEGALDPSLSAAGGLDQPVTEKSLPTRSLPQDYCRELCHKR